MESTHIYIVTSRTKKKLPSSNCIEFNNLVYKGSEYYSKALWKDNFVKVEIWGYLSEQIGKIQNQMRFWNQFWINAVLKQSSKQQPTRSHNAPRNSIPKNIFYVIIIHSKLQPLFFTSPLTFFLFNFFYFILFFQNCNFKFFFWSNSKQKLNI